jgi:hypothetical protein
VHRTHTVVFSFPGTAAAPAALCSEGLDAELVPLARDGGRRRAPGDDIPDDGEGLIRVFGPLWRPLLHEVLEPGVEVRPLLGGQLRSELLLRLFLGGSRCHALVGRWCALVAAPPGDEPVVLTDCQEQWRPPRSREPWR